MIFNFNVDCKDYVSTKSVFIRTAVRAIIKKNEKFALIKSDKYNEYKFPGGGMNEGESELQTLVREVNEETGLVVIPESVKLVGIVNETRKGVTADICKMKSVYYTCDVQDKLTSRHLDDYEAEFGYNLEWISLEDAIKNNRAILSSSDFKDFPWILRDTLVMEELLRL